MFDSMIQNDVPGVYASAHGGHSSLKSKENYVSSESASTKAINKILATNLSGEESSSFNDLVNVERSKVKDTIHNIKIRGKENQDPNISKESAPLRTGEALPGHPQALLPAGGPVHHPEQVKQAQLHHGQNQQDQLRPDMRLAHPSYDDGFPTTLGLGQALTYPQTQHPGLPMATAGQVHVPMSSGGHIQLFSLTLDIVLHTMLMLVRSSLNSTLCCTLLLMLVKSSHNFSLSTTHLLIRFSLPSTLLNLVNS